MNKDTIYFKQVQLLLRTIPLIATEACFALKGGTAINLFVRDIPRLSVDIDLVYLPMDERITALGKIRAALSRISALITQRIPGTRVQNTHEQSDALRLIVVLQDVRIKIELSPVIRGAVFPERIMSVSKKVEEQIGYAEIAVVSLPDLYAGKICAALDRQHPRDLFDVKFLLENEGFTDDFRKTFLVYLVSHQRPMAELLQPNRKDITKMYEDEFVRMTQLEVTIRELEEVRERLITEIHTGLTADEKKFLLSFKSKLPEWRLLGLQNSEEISNLPSVRWKMSNLEQMPVNKHQDAFKKLQAVFKNW
jgi:predicted nucleotidyltransferase component of viral defense system